MFDLHYALICKKEVFNCDSTERSLIRRKRVVLHLQRVIGEEVVKQTAQTLDDAKVDISARGF